MYSFIFTDSQQTLEAEGVQDSWGSVVEALSSGASLVVGALPFHPEETPALFAPQSFSFRRGAPELPTGKLPEVHDIAEMTSRGEHANRVEQAVSQIRSGKFQKLVLSREERYLLAAQPSPEVLLGSFLTGSGTGHGHLVDLGSAGHRYRGAQLIGSSPELLIAKRGEFIESYPLAGTIPRCPDPDEDQARADGLLRSGKDIAEHGFVTEDIRRVLEPYCVELEIPEVPSLTATSHTWHLGTRIRGRLKDPRVPVLELAAALHPTPAVCGFPTPRTQRELRKVEPGRGFYAGAVGWSDAAGNGQWRVSIRSAVLQGNTVRAHAGGGIVADSDAAAEVRETVAKLGPVRAALGLPTGDLVVAP